MFTGIIQAVGRVAAVQPMSGDTILHIETAGMAMDDVTLGDSIAVNGVCLTATAFKNHGFAADVSAETLQKTTFSTLKVGDAVNLEKALRASDRLGGHLVSGHVDGVAQIETRSNDGRSVRFAVAVPVTLAKYIAQKGSVCVDGVSLTVNAVNDSVFDVNIVPHTLENTIIGGYQPGTKINLEVDVIARYLERLVTAPVAQDDKSGVTAHLLKEYGFMRSEPKQ